MRILIIASNLPPYNGSGNIRLLNYINYLNRNGNKVDVIGVEYPKDSVLYDETLENVFDKEVNIYRANPGYFYNLFNTKKVYASSGAKISDHKDKNVLLNKIKRKVNYFIKTTFLIPDSFVGWIKPAYKIGCSLIEKNNYDLIFTIHETPSSHLVGLKLKNRHKKIKWVGYWSDPWNGDDAIRTHDSWIKRRIEERLEKKVVLSVDKLLFTSNATSNIYTEKYNLDANKTDIVYRGYDDKLYKGILMENNKPSDLSEGKINIVHTGTIYKELRDISPLCEALDKLKVSNSEIYNKLNIIFLGQFTDENDKKLLEKHSCVKTKNSLPFKEAIKYVVFADVLLLYGNKNSTQIPGKVYEYLGSKAKVLTILGSSYDELKDIMIKADKGPIISNTDKEIYGKITQLYYSVINNTNPEWDKPCELFIWDKVVKDLEEKLNCCN